MSDLKRYSVFDMDRTVTRSGTYSPWLLHFALREAPWRLALLPLSVLAALAYVAGFVSRGRLKEINHHLLMGTRVQPERLARRVESYADVVVPGRCFKDAIARIAAEQAEGREVVLATASYAFYVRAIADRLGVDRIVATGSKHDTGGAVLARLEGENCYDGAKLRMVEAALPPKDSLHVRFFSDHHSDAPMFEWADEAVAVNPTPKLRALAEARRWQVVEWS